MSIAAPALLAPIAKFFTDAGAPLSGGLVYSYASGTTTAQATYADSGLTTPNANPIVLDASGSAKIFLAAQTYRFDVQNSVGVSQMGYPVDGIADFGQLLAAGNLGLTSTITTTGTAVALALPAGGSASFDATIFANNATLLTVQGIAAGVDGQHLTIASIGAGQVDFAHQNAGATAANRLINIATSANTSLAAGAGVATFVYDLTAARWRMVTHEQGAWITPAFAAGDYTAATGNWTVIAGNVAICAYRLSGRTLQIKLNVASTTVSATPASLKRAIPGGFTSADASGAPAWARIQDNGGTVIQGLMIPTTSSLTFYASVASAGWSTSNVNTFVQSDVWQIEVT